MQLLDPTNTNTDTSKTRAPKLESLEGLTIGLLSNGKSNADHLIRMTAEKLVARHGGAFSKVLYKPHASEIAPTELLTNLAPECDYLITAAGD